MNWFMGIDIGSAYSKGVIVKDFKVIASYMIKSGANYRSSAEEIRAHLLGKANLNHHSIANTVATGSGSENVYFASRTANDIVCTARGIKNVFSQARTVIDVGSQSTRAMQLADDGSVTNFTVSEKCAAGSGRFIEVIASVLRIDLGDFSDLAAKSTSPTTFSTSCAVFGESEAITRISAGVPGQDIAAGANKALAATIASLVKRLKLEEPCAICGGGALNTALVKAVADELGIELLVPSHPQLITALGAAIIGATSSIQG